MSAGHVQDVQAAAAPTPPPTVLLTRYICLTCGVACGPMTDAEVAAEEAAGHTIVEDRP